MNQVALIQEKIKNHIPEGLVVARHSEYGHFYQFTPNGEVYPSVTTKTSITGGDHLKLWAVNQMSEYLEKHWDEITPENRLDIFKAARMAHVTTFKEAGDLGTRAHGILENYLKDWIASGIQPKDIKSFVSEFDARDARIIALVRSAELFFHDFHVIPIVSEMKIASPRYKYAGTMDALIFVGRVLKEGNGNRNGFAKCQHFWGSSRKGKEVECFHCGRRLAMELTLLDFKSSNSVTKDEYAEQISAYDQSLWELARIKTKNLYVIRLDKMKAKYELVRVTDRKKAFKAFLHTCAIYDWKNDGVTKLYPVVEREVIKL